MKITKACLRIMFAILLLPIAVSVFCNCCEASAPMDQLVIEKQPCQHCCDVINVPSSGCEGMNVEKLAVPFRLDLFFFSGSLKEKMIAADFGNLFRFSQHGESPPGIFDRHFSPPLSQPVYLLNQVFRL